MELLGHFKSNNSTKAPTAEQVWTVRLKFAEKIDIMRGHGFDGCVRLRALFEPEGLETVARLIGPKVVKKVSVTEDVTGSRVDQEDRRARAGFLQRHQARPIVAI